MKRTISIIVAVLSSYSSFGQSPAFQKLSWNICMLPGLIQPQSSNLKGASAIGEILANSDYDVIVFQEAFPFSAGPANRKLLRDSKHQDPSDHNAISAELEFSDPFIVTANHNPVK